MITLQKIQEAQKRIAPFINYTPLVFSKYLSNNSKVKLKLESLQITGSFKLRGAINKLLSLNEEQIERYSRHILLQDVGLSGQEKILKSKVLIIGTGGLGAPAALYLAAAGVGTLGIIDGDRVDLSNLQRQVIHFTPDLDKA